MTTKQPTPLLTVLQARHGAELGDRLLQLRTPAREDIANAAYAEGFLTALNMLGASLPALEKVMHEAGYGQCGGCEEWFPQLELEPAEDAEFLEVGENPNRCEECNLADDDWAAPPPPEPTTPEEIAAAEEKRNKAREAVIRQEERAAKRREILAGVPEPTPGTKPD